MMTWMKMKVRQYIRMGGEGRLYERSQEEELEEKDAWMKGQEEEKCDSDCEGAAMVMSKTMDELDEENEGESKVYTCIYVPASEGVSWPMGGKRRPPQSELLYPEGATQEGSPISSPNMSGDDGAPLPPGWGNSGNFPGY